MREKIEQDLSKECQYCVEYNPKSTRAGFCKLQTKLVFPKSTCEQFTVIDNEIMESSTEPPTKKVKKIIIKDGQKIYSY